MIIEFLQFFELLQGRFHYLIVHFVIFVLTISVIKRLASAKYKPHGSLSREDVKVSVIVPVYHEDLEIFEWCLASVRRNMPDNLIVVADCPSQRLASLARKYGDKVILRNERKGKRSAIIEGVRNTDSDIIVLLDSDTQMADGCLNELIKPFHNKKILAVASVHIPYPTNFSFGGYLSWKYSEQIEKGRRITDRALNGHLVVADGRCSAYRRNVILKYAEEFLNDIYFGKPSHIGDDRFLTHKINLEGGNVVVQETAKVYTASPKTFRTLLKQQLRWARSGRKFLLKEIRFGLWKKTGFIYAFHTITYYFSAFSLATAVFLDLLFFKMVFTLPLWFLPTTIIIGATSVNIIRQLILLGRETNIRDALWLGLIGAFILYPLSLYAWLTFHKQHIWGTR